MNEQGKGEKGKTSPGHHKTDKCEFHSIRILQRESDIILCRNIAADMKQSIA